jgi:hypothetical protein
MGLTSSGNCWAQKPLQTAWKRQDTSFPLRCMFYRAPSRSSKPSLKENFWEHGYTEALVIDYQLFTPFELIFSNLSSPMGNVFNHLFLIFPHQVGWTLGRSW